MKATIKIECVGDDSVAHIKLARSITKDLLGGRAAHAVFGSAHARYFVAEITATDEKFGYKRTFLPCKKDYRNSNATGSRGIIAHYIIDSGKIYDVKSPVSWRSSERYFCTVDECGDIVKLTKEEVDRCLKNR